MFYTVDEKASVQPERRDKEPRFKDTVVTSFSFFCILSFFRNQIVLCKNDYGEVKRSRRGSEHLNDSGTRLATALFCPQRRLAEACLQLITKHFSQGQSSATRCYEDSRFFHLTCPFVARIPSR